ncbi:MAG TPA: hypothetical protein VKK31_28950 [Thermoanaerobaculia bacterium]|nr:hypothetical protein [Thermoanaerobaculia bacterium]
MSRAETALDDTVEMQTTERSLPKPGIYDVKSTGAPREVPPGAVMEIVFASLSLVLKINGEERGPVEGLPNGDFKVPYTSGGIDMVLQCRQPEQDKYLFGVSMPLEGQQLGAMDDPPITGVWGAEARPGSPDPEG